MSYKNPPKHTNPPTGSISIPKSGEYHESNLKYSIKKGKNNINPNPPVKIVKAINANSIIYLEASLFILEI